MKIKKICLILILFIAFMPFGFSAANVFEFVDDFNEDENIELNIEDLHRMYQTASKSFLYDIDHKKIYEAMAEAMLDAFGDKWTQYISEEKASKYKEAISGEFTGIGVYLSKTAVSKQVKDDDKTLYVQISSCFNDSPASKAGIRSGDLITHIDGVSVIDKDATECSNLLRGPKGTTVNVTVKRKERIFETKITRDLITTPSVETELLDEKILYMRINSFTEKTSLQVSEQISKYVSKGLKGLIIDLRNNGGGEVKTCVEIADYFLDRNKIIVSSDSKVKNMQKTYVSTSGTLLPFKVPIVVLVNNGTASASEILSAALQENNRAILVGEKTYGKGVIQISIPWKKGFVNITTAEYKTPKGNKVHEIGITPDYEVKLHELSDEEAKLFVELENEKIVPEFIRNNPELNMENINKCIERITKDSKYSQLNRESLVNYLFTLYYLEMDGEKRNIAWPDFDIVLKKGLDVLKGNIAKN